MWMRVAAVGTSLALLAIPEINWEMRFVIFSIASIVAVLLGKTFFSCKEINTDDPAISQIESELIGNIYTVEKAIQNGAGRIIVRESTWKAIGPDCEVDNKVRVVVVKGSILEVQLV